VAKNVTQDVFVPVLDFSLPIWNLSEPGIWNSQLETNSIAVDAAAEMDVVALSRQVYASDWSYDLQFFGPSLQCHEPNSTEQVMFDNVTQWYEDENVFTFTDKNDKTSNDTFSIKSGELLYTSWSYWFARHTPNYLIPEPFTRVQSFYPQIWIQTSTSSIVCDSVNASFDLRIAYVDGVQTITQKSIQSLGNYNLDLVTVTDQEVSTVTIVNGTITGVSGDGGSSEVQWSPYLPHVYALGGVLSGNITLTNDVDANDASDPQYQDYGITSILNTGLMACDEIANSPFKDVSSVVTSDPVQTFTNTFPSEPWMCRNGTLMKALEDLANNITISYLSSPDLTNDNTTLRTIVTSNTYNIYQYHPFYLFLSYGLALLLSFVAALVGFYSLYLNGVSHSNSFSAIIATTRNMELDSLSTRSSLGADPRKVDLQNTRLKLGPLLNPIDEPRNKGEVYGHVTDEVPHVAFGFEENVGKLRKGALYI
jgi:hypothetical protein